MEAVLKMSVVILLITSQRRLGLNLFTLLQKGVISMNQPSFPSKASLPDFRLSVY